MAGIFISYRRDDSAGYSGRLMDDMQEEFDPEQIFRDIEAIEAGADFIEVIDQAVGSCAILLVLIGPRWLGATDSKGNRRLEDPHDFVRLEIAAALTRHGIKVIPVLVGGATMPAAEDLPEPIKPLARYQAHEITDRRWDYDVGRLFRTIRRILPGIALRKSAAPSAGTTAAVPLPAKQPKRGMPTGLTVLFGVIATVFALMIYGAFQYDKPAAELNLAPNQPPERMASATQLDALPPVAPVPSAAARVQSAKGPPAPSTTAAVPPPAAVEAAPVAPLNLTGNWRTQQGDAFYIEQSGTELAVMAADAQANNGFMGQGVLRGRKVELTLTHLQSGSTMSMHMDVSSDARRMSGVAKEHVAGTSQNLTLERE